MSDKYKEIWHRIGREAVKQLEEQGTTAATDRVVLVAMLYMGLETMAAVRPSNRLRLPWKVLMGVGAVLAGVITFLWDKVKP